jgi:hypothetical protein
MKSGGGGLRILVTKVPVPHDLSKYRAADYRETPSWASENVVNPHPLGQ